MNDDWRQPLIMNDYYWDPHATGQPVDDPYWFQNSVHDNAFSVVTRDGTAASGIFLQLGLTVTHTNNVDALGHLATTTDEQAEYVRWKQKLSANGNTVAPP